MRSPIGIVNFVSYFVLLIGLLLVRTKRASIVLLVLMLSRYAVIPAVIVVSAGRVL
jgi:hypothetical protein